MIRVNLLSQRRLEDLPIKIMLAIYVVYPCYPERRKGSVIY